MSNNNNRFAEWTSLKQNKLSLRSSEPEVRDFERRLRNIYISNNQVCQMKEKEYQKLQEEIHRKRETDVLLAEQMRDAACNKNEMNELKKKNNTYGKELLKQADCNKQQKVALKDQIKHEIEANKKLQESILEDLQRKKMERINKTNEIKYEMKLFNTAKNIQIKKKQILQLCESKRIDQAQKEQEERLHNLEEENKRKVMLKSSIQDKISSNMLAQKMAQQERLQLIHQLQEHEYGKNQSNNHAEEGVQKVLVRESMRNILKLQIDANVLREKNLKDDEDEYRKQLSLELQIHEQDHHRILIENQCKQAQYAADLKKQIKNDLEKRKQQKSSIRDIEDYVKRYNENIQQQILEEKEHILDEYTLKTNCMFK